MRILVSEKLSPHKMKTPEGYLICTDAILSRTGKQTYRRSEIWGDACDNAEGEVEVDRKAEEVFNDKTLASFENKPICIEHPDEDVNVSNHNQLSVGFVRDIKRGKVEGQDVMLGTLVITDADAIEAIERGDYTELSCGYNCDIVDEDNPQQRNIRGNHVALCEHGRAGIARIVDSIDDAGIKVWQVRQGYAIVVKRYWQQYGRNAFVDATESNIDDARYRRGSLERNDKMAFVIIDCNDGKYKIEDEGMKDIQATKTPGTDKIIYVMQSDVDKNLYFYIGKTFSMKEGTWGYTKFEMGGTTPEQLKAELTRNGWHQVASGPARVIDMNDERLIKRTELNVGMNIRWKHHGEQYEGRIKRVEQKGSYTKIDYEDKRGIGASFAFENEPITTTDSWTVVEEENYEKANETPLKKDATRQTIIEKLRSISIPYGERWQLIDGAGWTIDVQHHGLARHEAIELANPNKNRHVSSKEYSLATIRIWYNSKMLKKIEGPLNVAKAEAIRFLQGQTNDSVEKVFSVSYTKDGVTYINKVRANSITDAVSKVKDDVSNIKDVYNKFEHETDKEYLKSSINEMSRYISNWSFMSTREKRNISPEGLSALKQMLKFAQQRLAELK